MIVRDLGGEAERQAALEAATPTLHASPLPPMDEPTAEPTELALPTPPPEPPPEPRRSQPPPVQLNTPPPTTPKLRRDGIDYNPPDIATLQRWILQRLVSGDDQVSLSGESWQLAQNVPELEVFFRTLARLDDLERQQQAHDPAQPAADASWETANPPSGEARGRPEFMDDDWPMSLSGVTEERGRGSMDPFVRTQEAPWRQDAGYNGLSDSIQETVEIHHRGLRPLDDSDVGEPTEIAHPFTRDPTDELAPAAIFVPSKPAESPFAMAMGPSLESNETATTTLRELTPEPRLSAAHRAAAVLQEEVELPPMRDDDPADPPEPGVSWGPRIIFGASFLLLLGIVWWTTRPDATTPTTTPATPVPEAAAVTPPVETPTPETPAIPTTTTDPPQPTTPTPPPVKIAKAPPTTAPKPPEPEPAICATAKACSDRGWKAIGAGDYSEGRIMFIEALALDPKNADAHYGMGYAALRQGDTATALRKFCQARQYAGNNADLAREVAELIAANNGTCD